MESLLSRFPADNFSLLGVILAFPLLGAIVNGIWGKRLGKEGVRFMALAAVGVSFIASVASFLSLSHLAGHGGGEHAEHVKLKWSLWSWMHTSQGDSSTIPIDVTFSVDALSGVMMLVVTGVGFLIHLYATSYMEKDSAYWRFFAYLNLFIFSMLVLILGDNLPVLFVGWEGVGLCSYLLIGFWYGDNANATAGKKAFIANRIGDFGLICGMFLLAHYCGALDWDGLSANASKLVNKSAYAGNKDLWDIGVWPLAHSRYEGMLTFLQPGMSTVFEFLKLAPMTGHPVTLTILPATAVGLALLLGCTGKSAQIPLYVWLPDAMAGPTPVSALIHAATMVTAGVYLCCRLWFVFALSPFVMVLIAFIGVITALLAASIALVQNDIKKVLAYSTISQLGFMFVGVGVGAFVAGFFHVITHAFFKACLFLGAGSVIHAMHARIHDGDASQDMRNMGGLKKYMPITYWTFAAATVAIIGLPGTSGFFSKDEILFRAFTNQTNHPFEAAAKALGAWQAPAWTGKLIYGLGVVAALMTAFYMVRLFLMTFHGDFRGWKVADGFGHDHRDHAEHGHDHHDDLEKPGGAPQESPWQMTLPLILLGGLSLVAGFLNPGFHIFEHPPLEHWLDPVFDIKHIFASAKPHVIEAANAASLEKVTALGGIGAFVIGTGLSYWMYAMQGGAPARNLATTFPRVHRLLLNKWYVDEAYEATAIEAVDALADTSANVIDPWIVDGVLAKLSAFLVSAFGTLLRAFQNGVMHMYAALMVVGLAVCGWFFVMPHAQATVDAKPTGVAITAAAGPGYTYRWDLDGDGKPDQETFSSQPVVNVPLEPGASRNVTLEVTNSFGYTPFIAKKTVSVSRPASTDIKPTEIKMGPK